MLLGVWVCLSLLCLFKHSFYSETWSGGNWTQVTNDALRILSQDSGPYLLPNELRMSTLLVGSLGDQLELIGERDTVRSLVFSVSSLAAQSGLIGEREKDWHPVFSGGLIRRSQTSSWEQHNNMVQRVPKHYCGKITMAKLPVANLPTTVVLADGGDSDNIHPNSDRLSQNHAILCVSANNEVEALLLNKGQKRKHGEYGRCDPTLQAQIAKYAVHHGNTAAAHYFAKILGRYLNESTVRGYVKKYNLELAKSQDSDNIDELPQPKRGKPLLLSKELDDEVAITGLDDKKKITGLMGISMSGNLLPLQLIYKGTTSSCHPNHRFPDDWHITHSENHWSTTTTMLDYVNNIVSAYVNNQRENLDLPIRQKGLVIINVFRTRQSGQVIQALKDQGMEVIFVPAYCTSELQPLDVSGNGFMLYHLSGPINRCDMPVLELLKEMNQSRLAKISPLSQPIISGLVTDKTSDKISAQKAQEFGSWYLQYRAQHFGIHHFTNSSNLPKDSRFTFHPTKELPYMRSLYRQNKNPTDSALLLFVEELNCSEVRQHERPKVTLEKLKNWWKNERQRGKKVIVTSKNSRSQHKPNSLLRITSAFFVKNPDHVTKINMAAPGPSSYLTSYQEGPQSWTNTNVRYAVLELLKEMNQSTLAKLSPLSQPLISGIVNGKYCGKFSEQKRQDFGNWYISYRKENQAMQNYYDPDQLPKDSRFTFHPTRELPYMRMLFKACKNPTESMFQDYTSELNSSEIRQQERPKVTVEKLKNWWKNQRQREKRLLQIPTRPRSKIGSKTSSKVTSLPSSTIT
ncbi:DNA-binding protein SATB2 [Nymphon striatum]|nr:DNA-binding protein SATB2 [Nymphon striatum]